MLRFSQTTTMCCSSYTMHRESNLRSACFNGLKRTETDKPGWSEPSRCISERQYSRNRIDATVNMKRCNLLVNQFQGQWLFVVCERSWLTQGSVYFLCNRDGNLGIYRSNIYLTGTCSIISRNVKTGESLRFV